MNIILDFGNTNVKLITNKEIIFFKNTKDNKVIASINKWVNENTISKVLIINVGIDIKYFQDFTFTYELFNNEDILKYLDFELDVNKFGCDRIANLLAYKKQNPNQSNFIILDFGTYLTIDVIINNKYSYGRILLGVSKQLQQICTSAQKINLTSIDVIKATNENTTQGQIKMGLIEQYNFLIETYKLKYPSSKIIVTGHDLELINCSDVICDDKLLSNLI